MWRNWTDRNTVVDHVRNRGARGALVQQLDTIHDVVLRDELTDVLMYLLLRC